MQTENQRRHRFFDRFTILGALVLMIIGILVCQALGTGLGIPIGSLSGNKEFGDGIGTAIVAFLLLWFYKFWFRPEFEGNLRGGDIKLGFKLAIIYVVYWVTTTPIAFLSPDVTFGAPTLSTIAMAIMAGTSEEMAFRGLPISYLMRQWREEKHILTAVLLTAGVFGLIHLQNVFAGGNPGSVVAQTISAFCTGVTLGAIYLRCGNLLITILIHTVHDIIAFLDVSGVQGGVVVASIDWNTYLDVGVSVVMAIIGFWLIRPAKRVEIRALWDRKWRIETESL